MRTLLIAGALTLVPLRVLAQAPSVETAGATATKPRHDVAAGLSGYNYVEPGDLAISIHGVKFSGEYTGTFLLDQRRRWFVRANARASFGSTNYDGWCAPWQIAPESASPNGYRLDLGEFSQCTDTGNGDRHAEGRAVTGRDLGAGRWTWSPEAGVGIRHLSNNLASVSGYRTQVYLYVPLGFTARTMMASRVLSLSFEYDQMIRGWQQTRQSRLGGGIVPATATTPGFTLEGFTDVAFDQRRGSAVRASAKYEMNRRWSVEPYWIYWSVGDSSPDFTIATFTVNGITVQEQLGFYEPQNTTNEAGVKFSFRIR